MEESGSLGGGLRIAFPFCYFLHSHKYLHLICANAAEMSIAEENPATVQKMIISGMLIGVIE